MQATPVTPAPPSRDLERRVVDRLRRAGARYTATRRTVVEALRVAPGPRTVAGLSADLGDTIPLSSLYRTLTVLDEVGVARRVPGDAGAVGYELAEEVAGHHHHLVCAGCGRTFDVDADPEVETALERIAAGVAAGAGFTVTGHRLALEGRCAGCAA